MGDGVAALQFLRHQGENAGASRGSVLLDLSLPRMDGHAVLRAIDDALRSGIPVVVFTTSSNQQDIAASYGSRANAVVTKPINLDDFIEAVPPSKPSGSRPPPCPPSAEGLARSVHEARRR
ncbi:MAG: response regulator [Thermomicrobiales bacterium]